MGLIKVIREGNVGRVKQLLESGADASRAEDGETPLITAIDEHQPEVFAALLQHNADVNGVDGQGYTPLVAATGSEEPEMVRVLLAAGVNDLESIPRQFPPFTALMWACHDGQLDIVRMLLEAGADANKANEHGQSPLIMAVEFPAIVSLLLEHGADANRQTSAGYRPLPCAASEPRGHGIRPLLAGGANPNLSNRDGTTPLLAAVQQKLTQPVRWLLTAGADPNVSFQEDSSFDAAVAKGATPLIYAASTGRVKIVEALLQAGAQWDRKDSRERTAHDVALAQGHADIVQLLEQAAGPSQPTKRKTPEYYSAMLLQATKRGNLAQVMEALQNRADPNVADQGLDFGKTPLIHACERGSVHLVKALIAGGADVDRREPEHSMAGQGYTALHYAAELGHAACVSKLLEAGAALEIFDERGYTPLMSAIRQGHSPCVQTLLQSGANPLTIRQTEDSLELEDETMDEEELDEADDFDEEEDDDCPDDFEPQTALGLAAREGHLAVMRMLLDAADQKVPGALVDASGHIQPAAVQLLLDDGYPVRVVDHAGSGPLHVLGQFEATVVVPRLTTPILDRSGSAWFQVAIQRQLAVAHMLLEAGAPVHETDAKGRTPLMLAARARTSLTRQTDPAEDAEVYDFAETDPTDYLRLLLEAGADPNAGDDQGNMALHHAFRRGFMEPSTPSVVGDLIKAGADLNAQNLRGRTPLMLAIKSDDMAGIENLLRRGASVHLRDRRGRTVLHYAIEFSRPERLLRLLRLLLDAGADPALADRNGQTPLADARDSYSKDAVKFLKKIHAVDTSENEVQLARAIKKKDLTTVRDLLDAGADMNRQVRQQNAFVRAVVAQAVEVVEELITRGADIHQTDRSFPFGRDSQALHFAASLKEPQLLQKLLHLGADPCAGNARGWTPVTVASITRQPENVQLLLQAGGSVDSLAEDFLELLSFDTKTQAPDYSSAVEEVTMNLGAKPQPFGWAKGLVCWPVDASEETRQKLQRDPKLSQWAASRQAQAEKRETLIAKLQPLLRERGLLLVGVQSGRGCSSSSGFLALFPTTNPFALIAAMGVYGNEAEISCPELVAMLRKLHQREPFDLHNMKNDALDIVFRSLVREPKKTAKVLYKICPDIVDQNLGSMKRLVESLETSPQVHFWWD